MAAKLRRLRAPVADQQRGRRARQVEEQRAVALDLGRIELQRRPHAGVGQRPQIEEPGDGDDPGHRRGHAVVPRPVGEQGHQREVTAGGMAAHEQARRIAADGGGVAPAPGHGGASLSRDLVDGHRRAERVGGNHHADAAPHQAQRHEVELLGREHAPVAAVEEDQDRGRPAVPGWGREDVDGLRQGGAVGQRRRVGQGRPRLGALAQEVLDHRREGRNGAVDVVLGVELRLRRELAVKVHARPAASSRPLDATPARAGAQAAGPNGQR